MQFDAMIISSFYLAGQEKNLGVKKFNLLDKYVTLKHEVKYSHPWDPEKKIEDDLAMWAYLLVFEPINCFFVTSVNPIFGYSTFFSRI